MPAPPWVGGIRPDQDHPAPAGVPFLTMCRVAVEFVGHIVKSGNLGEGAPEKRAEATKQAAEPNAGGQRHPRTTSAPRRRSEASWNGGAAERDSRPVM